MADQDYHLTAAEQRGYDRAVKALREEAAKAIAMTEWTAREFSKLAHISHTAAECAALAAIHVKVLRGLVEHVVQEGTT